MIKVLKILHHILPSLGQTQVRRQRLGSLRRRAGLGVGSLILLLLCSCSETKNLAENETLYVGIKEIAYDRMPKHQGESSDTTGVIAALGMLTTPLLDSSKAMPRLVKPSMPFKATHWRLMSHHSLHCPLTPRRIVKPMLRRRARWKEH